MPAVSVIIPARNAATLISRTLAALAAQSPHVDHEVLVVDDASNDATARVAKEGGARVVTASGAGPAAARNLGAAAASGEVLAFTDADCVPEPGWLHNLLREFDAGADLVQGRVLPPEGVSIGPYDRYIAVVAEYGLYETANLALRRELFDALGGFESILTPRNGIELGEDVWLGWRARRMGARTTFATAAVVRHAVFPRGPVAYVEERLRLRFFPELAARIPELRDGFLHHRVFLNARSQRFDLAVAGVAVAGLVRSPIPLLAAAPYATVALRTARTVPGRRRKAEVLVAHVLADAVGAGALAYGSIRSRTLVA